MADTQKTYETPYEKRRKLLLHVIALYHHQTNLNILIAQYVEEERKKNEVHRNARRWWTRPWLMPARRENQGTYANLMVELLEHDPQAYRNFTRVDPALFQELTDRLTPRIEKRSTYWRRKPHPPGLKLAITLRYVASGNDYHSLMYQFRVPHNTISLIVREVCEAIIAEYTEEVLTMPTNAEEWKGVSKVFAERWQFYNCLGALDGKHVRMKNPRNGGSLFFNYKGYFSLSLLGLVDGDYKFLWASVGHEGSCSDAQIWNNSELKDAIDDNTIGFPDAAPLPGDDAPLPFFLIGDDAFALNTCMMKPYSRRSMERAQIIFNYRLSRARRIVENAFGILANRYRCLLTTMAQDADNV